MMKVEGGERVSGSEMNEREAARATWRQRTARDREIN